MTGDRPPQDQAPPPLHWGETDRLRIVVLAAVGLLGFGLLAIVATLIHEGWRDGARLAGVPVVPQPDPAQANAKAKPQDLQRVLGDPALYPEDARSKRQQGLTVARLRIGNTGRAVDCRIAETSGFASLDRATCAAALDRIFFEPARDARGVPTESSFVLRMRWTLPPE